MKIEKVQRQALLYVACAYKKTSHNELLKEVGLPLLEKRRQSQKIQFIYKANENLLPEYLVNTIPQMVGDQITYNLRQHDHINIPLSHKKYDLKSYIPSAIKMWNDTRIDIRRAISLQSLKSKLRDLYRSTSYHLYLAEDGNGAVNHSRIRMGLSGLNAQRRKYKFIQNSTCSFCNHKREDPKHFFLICPAFAAHRQQMLDDLVRDVPGTVQPLLNAPVRLTRILIVGTGRVDVDKILFTHVQKYISATNRFK